ncbi:MAG: hypothetical protein ACKVS6_10350, partial [Planctomycetota bacterium]
MRESTMSPSIKPFAVIAALAIAVAITTFIFIFGFGTIEPGGDDLTKTESAPAIENADLASASRAAIDTPKRVVAKTERELRT